MIGDRRASSTIPIDTVPLVPDKRVVNREEGHKDRSSSYFWKSKTAREVNRRQGDSSSQLFPLGLSCSCPSCTANPTLLAHRVPSGLVSSSLPPHHPQSLLLHRFHMHTHTHTAHSLVIAVPVQFNVLQVGCMCNDISILLYQLRISRQLFLK